MSNEMISWVLRSKFGMVPQILKKRSVKALLRDNLQTEDFYMDVDTIIVKMKK